MKFAHCETCDQHVFCNDDAEFAQGWLLADDDMLAERGIDADTLPIVRCDCDE